MRASVVIPVLDDSRNAYLDQLLPALGRQSLQDFEVILVIGDNRQGRAINNGVREARGRWIITMDDDSHVDDDHLLEKLVTQMEADPTIGMGGGACRIPEWATSFQKRAMRQIPRRWFPVQEMAIDSDFVQHPCLIIEKELFEKIGGEDEELVRGLDPVLRKKVRDAGRRVCILADVAVAHLIPDGMTRVFQMYRRNGRGSAFAQKFFPQRVIELTDGHEGGDFVEKRPLPYRVMRRLGRLFSGLVQGQYVRQIADVGYVLGWVEGWFLGDFPEGKGRLELVEDAPASEAPVVLRKLRVTRRHNTVEEQIARLHVSSDPEFVLGDDHHSSLDFYRDKVGVHRNYAGEGFLYETDDQGQVTGFLILLPYPGRFKKTLLKQGYAVRYLVSVITGRYSGAVEGWGKWLRLPLAFLQPAPQHASGGGAKIVAFVVREDLRGQGIGSRLLKRAEDISLSFGRHNLEVTVNKDNEGAKRLYERHGFVVAGEVLESTGASWYLDKSVGVP